MKLTNGFSPEEQRLTIKVESNLLKKYFNNFSGIINNHEGLPEGTRVEQKGVSSAEISFPIPKSTRINRIDDEQMSIVVNADDMNSITDAINDFINQALKYELKHTEFIPLNGYPVEDLKKDIQAAVQAKRDLCIIGEYSEYLKMQEERKYTYHQYIVKHGTIEYAEAALLIYEEKINELQDIYSSKLTLTDWY